MDCPTCKNTLEENNPKIVIKHGRFFCDESCKDEWEKVNLDVFSMSTQ
jgi:hypothetical protein